MIIRTIPWFHFQILSFSITGLTESGVTQSPSHKVTEKGQAVALWCDPSSGHRTLYWYRQTQGRGLGLLISFENEATMDDSQLPKDRFSAERPKGKDSTQDPGSRAAGLSRVFLCQQLSHSVTQKPPSCAQNMRLPPSPCSSRQLRTRASPRSSLGKGRKPVCREKL